METRSVTKVEDAPPRASDKTPHEQFNMLAFSRSYYFFLCLVIGSFVALQPIESSGQEQKNRRWPDERQVGMFAVHADFSLQEELATVNELETLQQDIAQTLQLNWPKEPIHLFLFGDRRTYTAYLKRYFPSAPDRRALFIKNGGPGMVFAYRSRDLAVDIRHEATHALLHTTLPVVPLWLDEGLAEYFERPRRERAFENPHAKSLRWRVFVGRAPSIKELESVAEVQDMHSSDYQHAWSWVHFMLHGPESAKSVLHDYLQDLNRHQPPGVFSERLRQRIPDLERAYVDHFRHWARDE
ncbi:MAG TPA: DUF1570 domain-containing protein [Planctomycetaceae bacterium]|nr:DUF1570 domain-containing protein [Planctomycetaceae bacterium]